VQRVHGVFLEGLKWVGLRAVAGLAAISLIRKSVAPHQSGDKADDGHDGEDEKKNFGDFDGTGGDTTKAEYSGDQGDHQEHNGIMQHLNFLAGPGPWVAAFAIEPPAASLGVAPESNHR
jgi:hypothetical protein